MLLVAFAATGAFAQGEYDDMYFNSKDRAKMIASRNTLEPSLEKKARAKASDDEINPTDSYSARNVNPEYTSRADSEIAQADDEDYFINNYKIQTQNQFNSWNRNYNNWYNSPWYSSASFGYGMNSPYYNNYYSPYSSPWYDPYYSNGWSSSLSFYAGSRNYGWGMNYGYGCPYNNYWNSPYYSSFYSPFNSWYSPYGYYGYGGYGYGAPVIVVVNDGNTRGPVYGKRSTRGTSFVQNNGSGDRGRSSYTNRTVANTGSSNGRTTTRKQDEYYQRTWQSTNSAGNTQQDSRTTTRQNRSSSWSTGNNNSSWSSPSNNSSWSNSGRSSGSTGGATRSHSGGSGSGSNGRTRGRN